ncbi:MAG: peptidase domain-containing ABC transporter [Ignavibacteriae bacterium]|nr:peptidase domain-containing ABC transporter [Ignavibacteriota bacterium]
MFKKKFPFYRQIERMDCGAACIRMIAKYYGKEISLTSIKNRCSLEQKGLSLLSLSSAAESFGLKTLGIKIDLDIFINRVCLPAIVHWKEDHYVVVYKINKKNVLVADPAFGLIKYSLAEFINGWLIKKSEQNETGIALIIEPTEEFLKRENETSNEQKFSHLFDYIAPYKFHFINLLVGLVIGSFLQLCLPFITQNIIDKGINTRDISLIHILLVAQLAIFIGKTFLDFLQSWVILHVSARINISMISDFLIKLMKLPSPFFKNRKIGDILQRIGDHKRIELFVTNNSLYFIYNFFNILIFGSILMYYNSLIFLIFLLSSVIYLTWILLLLKRRKIIDKKRFENSSTNNSNLIQIISGIDEIKLNNCEQVYRWAWEKLQAKLFNINLKGLALNQIQSSGALFISQIRNLIITYIIAISVVEGKMTLGVMLAVMTILGYLNSPLDFMINFTRSLQDAQISLERLNEINMLETEEAGRVIKNKMVYEDINLKSICFSYNNNDYEYILNGINLNIPSNKITAITGASGCGKTTLIKLLLGLLVPTKGHIYIGANDLRTIELREWRQQCGAVMQDGFIFSDTVLRNIALSNTETMDYNRILYSSKLAMVDEFIKELPQKYETKIGLDAHNLSQGQKQRILLARAIYKDPKYFFLDEATNSLDSRNEKIITDNLNLFFENRTVIIIAHRLSTIKNAHNIITLGRGEVLEQGSYCELIRKKGNFYQLFLNQLEEEKISV